MVGPQVLTVHSTDVWSSWSRLCKHGGGMYLHWVISGTISFSPLRVCGRAVILQEIPTHVTLWEFAFWFDSSVPCAKRRQAGRTEGQVRAKAASSSLQQKGSNQLIIQCHLVSNGTFDNTRSNFSRKQVLNMCSVGVFGIFLFKKLVCRDASKREEVLRDRSP